MESLGRPHDATAASDLVEHPQPSGIDVHTAKLTWILRKLYLLFSDKNGNHEDMSPFSPGT